MTPYTPDGLFQIPDVNDPWVLKQYLASLEMQLGQAFPSATPTLYSAGGAGAKGLRRWYQASSNALNAQAFCTVVGDSHVFGVGGNDANSGLVTDNVADSTKGWVGQLRQLAQLSEAGGATAAGEGYIFQNSTLEGRTSVTGGATTKQQTGPLRRNVRLIGAAQNVSYTVETGVTSLGIIQANQTAAFNAGGTGANDVSANWSKGGAGQGAVTTLTNTGVPIETRVAVTAGDVIAITGPLTAATYITGIATYKASTGIVVNRMGVGGLVLGDVLGGQTSGALTFATTTSDQNLAVDTTHAWHTPGLVVLSFLSNDQQFQAGNGGTTAQSGVTSGIYTGWLQTIVNRIVANGHCCLVLGGQRSATAYSSGDSEGAYVDAMKRVALSTDHVSFADMGEVFGTSAQMQTASQQFASSPHMRQVAHALYARAVWRLINPVGPYGYTIT